MEENEKCDFRSVNAFRVDGSTSPPQTTPTTTTLRPWIPIKFMKPHGENVLRVRMSTYIPANLGKWLEVNLIQIVLLILNSEHPIGVARCFVKVSYNTTAMWVFSLARISSKVKTLFYDRVFLSAETLKQYKQIVEHKWRGDALSRLCDMHFLQFDSFTDAERRFYTSLKEWEKMVKQRYWSRFTKVIRFRSGRNLMATQLPYCRSLKDRIASYEQQQEKERIASWAKLYPNATRLPHCESNDIKNKKINFDRHRHVEPKCTDAFFERHNNNPYDQRKRRRTEENEKRLENAERRRNVRVRIINEIWHELSKEERSHYRTMAWDVDPKNPKNQHHDSSPYFDEDRGIIML